MYDMCNIDIEFFVTEKKIQLPGDYPFLMFIGPCIIVTVEE